ncbi:MAG: DUF1501 domain-containing protein [Pirellulaceae bacterium]|nr:DUF1501 domain-containing protein [Pirellulaceae bacterium]
MLGIGRLNDLATRSRAGRVTRRHLLEAGALSAVGVTLGDWLRLAHAQGPAPANTPARSVILLWLWGGPSHLDTFDMKPDAPLEYRGPYSPIATAVPGLRICELLPQLAQRADRYSLLRSLHCSSNDHGIAGTIGLTGSDAGAVSLGGQTQPGKLQPTHGSIVSRVHGFAPGIPRFLTLGGHLHQGHRAITGEDGGSLGRLYDPFRLDYDAEHGVRIPRLELLDGLSPSGLDAREQLRRQVEGLAGRIESSAAMGQLDQFYRQAYSLLTSRDARQVFDLDREPESVRRLYGRYRFGQCCLLARRLVEAGARFVQVNWSSHVEPVEDTGDGGWDMHDRNFQQFQDRHSWMLDQAVSALLDDLQQRGLLAETIVVAVGEFGRTPKINAKAGRDHWHTCYSGLVAGGGLRGGQVVGASDSKGEYPATRPVTPADLFTTVFHQLGIRSPELTSAGLLPQGEVIEELIG